MSTLMILTRSMWTNPLLIDKVWRQLMGAFFKRCLGQIKPKPWTNWKNYSPWTKPRTTYPGQNESKHWNNWKISSVDTPAEPLSCIRNYRNRCEHRRYRR
uniref:Uncharacterized protein n=1 Tax=Cacopsylla melanoneura TaxID=428564 RepID=A0A8D8UG44_9HEMI